MVEISTDSLEHIISSNIGDFLLIPEGFSSEDACVNFEIEHEPWGSRCYFGVVFRRLETDEELAERLEKTKKEEEKNRAAHEKRRKTAEANKEKKEKELFEKLKAKYEST